MGKFCRCGPPGAGATLAATDQSRQQEAVMTEPRGTKADAAADPEVRPDAIQDLDVTGDDADRIAGGGEYWPQKPDGNV
jgi:hypothetical protein